MEQKPTTITVAELEQATQQSVTGAIEERAATTTEPSDPTLALAPIVIGIYLEP